ncbi:hypothetical protein AVEN_265458-1 [Araneus ventricosus]|uniref:Uncharacterized protein n=1 Tax=Araneus ventricosus TaxID=182803 RepID=A0A4Y2CJF3_ARAVE|nr:hypothetical protein AVEN_265458-1 [Araneus ventricosus]
MYTDSSLVHLHLFYVVDMPFMAAAPQKRTKKSKNLERRRKATHSKPFWIDINSVINKRKTKTSVSVFAQRCLDRWVMWRGKRQRKKEERRKDAIRGTEKMRSRQSLINTNPFPTITVDKSSSLQPEDTLLRIMQLLSLYSFLVPRKKIKKGEKR